MDRIQGLTAAVVPYSSVVGQSVTFSEPFGAVLAQVAIMVPRSDLDAETRKDLAQKLAAEVARMWNGRSL